MPNFGTGSVDVQPSKDLLKEKPSAEPLHIDWFSAKHQLLTLFYCFDANHAGLRVVREWAANSTLDQAQKDAFAAKADQTLDRLDREAVRLNSFLTLGARRIDAIHAKFRPSKWYCQVPIVRQYVDHTSRKCTPIRTAQAG